jgi:hypothetical protein
MQFENENGNYAEIDKNIIVDTWLIITPKYLHKYFRLFEIIA